MLLLIGNGPSADTPEVARAMAKASRVLRMNNWQPGLHIGERCDIWGTSFNVDILPRSAKEVWWTGWPYGCPGHDDYEKVLADQKAHYDQVAGRVLIDRAFAATSRHPSTGIILAMMAVEAGGDLALAGFDNFSVCRHHYWTNEQAVCDPIQYHDPQSEYKILKDLGLPPID